MNGEKLFEAMAAIDDDILERSEAVKPKRRLVFPELIAASLLLLASLTAVFLVVKNRQRQSLSTQPVLSETTAVTPKVLDTPYYNAGSFVMNAQEWVSISKHDLLPEEVDAILPAGKASWMAFSGVCERVYGPDMAFLYNRIHLTTHTTLEGWDIKIVLGKCPQNHWYSEPVSAFYRCDSVIYTLWTAEQPGINSTHTALGASAEICGLPVYLSMTVLNDQVELAKKDFEQMLSYLAAFSPENMESYNAPPASPAEYLTFYWYKETLDRFSEHSILFPQDAKLYSHTISGYWEPDDFIVYTDLELDDQTGCHWAVSSVSWFGNESMTASSRIDAEELTLQKLEENALPDVYSTQFYVMVNFGDALVEVTFEKEDIQWVYEELLAARRRKAIHDFAKLIEGEIPLGMGLTIYYMDPTILTWYPLDGETLKTASSTKTICVDSNALAANAEALKKLTPDLANTGVDTYMNARMCYEFTDAQGNTLLEIVFCFPEGPVFINGDPVAYSPEFLEAIEPFLTEDFYNTWRIPTQ